ncbi:hypothetical protein JW979_11015 [bacterium]|nr:hypothetical protein [candidate division CSSED10-310 bacterium]
MNQHSGRKTEESLQKFLQPCFLGFLIVFLMGYYSMFMIRENPFSYSIDDPYIHMSIARNFSSYGVWGITPYGFTSSSSSPLYTLLLAGCFLLTGPWQYWPLVLNYVFAALLLYRIQKLCEYFGLPRWQIVVTQAAICILTPLVLVVSTGMEHIMHAFLVFLLLEHLLHMETEPSLRNRILLGVYCFLATAARYETLFVISVVSIWLLIRKRIVDLMISICAALAPVIIFGAATLAFSGNILPDSIRLKGNFRITEGFGFFFNDLITRILPRLNFYYYLKPLLGLLLVLLFFKTVTKHPKFLNLLFVLTLIVFALQIMFADIGWKNRYEFYLVSLAMTLICMKALPLISKSLHHKKYILIFGLLFFSFYFCIYDVFKYTRKGFKEITLCMDGVYVQNHQMAKFISLLPEDTCVAVNDIGAVTFFNPRLRIMDIWGLGTPEVADLLISGDVTKEKMNRIAVSMGVEYAVVYRGKFEPLIPDEWVDVGMWHDVGFSATGGYNIYFCCANPNKLVFFRERFKRFSETQTIGVITQVIELPPG